MPAWPLLSIRNKHAIRSSGSLHAIENHLLHPIWARSGHAFGHENWYYTNHTGYVSESAVLISSTHLPVFWNIPRCVGCNSRPGILGRCVGIPSYKKYTGKVSKISSKRMDRLTVGPHSQQSLLTPRSNLYTDISYRTSWV